MIGDCLVPGSATGEVLLSHTGLSFMGGVDASDGTIIDTHHPRKGQNVGGKIIAIPSGRGSCAGSLAIFELLMNGHAPAALIFLHRETILTLGVIIAKELFGKSIPVIQLSPDDFALLETARFARVRNAAVDVSDLRPPPETTETVLPPLPLDRFSLTEMDRKMLAGEDGEAASTAMRIILRTALLEGADSLVDVSMAHIDGCFYHGPGSLAFARKLLEMGARVRVPSTMNAIRTDRRTWKHCGIDPLIGHATDELADAYVALGVKPTYTCAPYLLDEAPKFGQQIAWGESNAVVFANSAWVRAH